MCFFLSLVYSAQGTNSPTEKPINDYYAAVQELLYIYSKGEQICSQRIRERIWKEKHRMIELGGAN